MWKSQIDSWLLTSALVCAQHSPPPAILRHWWNEPVLWSYVISQITYKKKKEEEEVEADNIRMTQKSHTTHQNDILE